MKQKTLNHKKIYVSMFSKITEHAFGYETEDMSQRDKYYHNYLNITNETFTNEDILAYINKTKVHGFSVIRTEEDIEIDQAMIKDATIDTNGIYGAPVEDLKFKVKVDATVSRVDPDKDEDFFDFLYQDSKNYGESYAIGNTIRQKQVLEAAKNIYGYFMIKVDGKVIGTLNYCIHEQMAKLDDFVIADDYQKKGYWSKLMHDVIEYLKKTGINYVYLVTDLDDTAKELYQKIGFKYITKYQIITIK